MELKPDRLAEYRSCRALLTLLKSLDNFKNIENNFKQGNDIICDIFCKRTLYSESSHKTIAVVWWILQIYEMIQNIFGSKAIKTC